MHSELLYMILEMTKRLRTDALTCEMEFHCLHVLCDGQNALSPWGWIRRMMAYECVSVSESDVLGVFENMACECVRNM